MENLQRIDGPVGVLECRRVVLDVIDTGVGLGAARTIGPNVSSPIAAVRQIKHNLVVVEKAVNITTALELCARRTP